MALAAILLALGLFPAPPGNLLDVENGPAERFIVARTHTLPGALLEDRQTLSSPMLARLADVALEGRSVGGMGVVGVMGVHEGAEARALRSAGPGTEPSEPLLGVESVAFIHARGRTAGRVLELAQAQTGQFVMYELDGKGQRGREVVPKQDVIASLMTRWNMYEGSFGPGSEGDAGPVPGKTVKLAGAYRPGWVAFDQGTLGRRLLAGGKTEIAGATRVLATQELFVRLPKAYSPRKPAGLVIWIDPGETGVIPQTYEPALDELNLIAVGAAGMGNAREMADRLQLAMDCLATAACRFHVDPARVYITGVSGGGRLASTLLACFPEQFTGAIPVVGVSCYENLPTGTGGFWAGGYRKPQGKLFSLFQKRPMAIITGDRDFNQPEIHRARDVFSRDRCTVKVFEWEDLGHALPSPDRLLMAVQWVDEPARAAEQRATAAAERALGSLREMHTRSPLAIKALKAEVARITNMAPWSEPAWEAVELLRSAERGAAKP